MDVTLDPDSASAKLLLSEDGKEVRHQDLKQDLPKTRQRFSYSPCVLGKQGFSSGRFYYEILVGEKIKWDLGVAAESINRMEPITLCPQNGFWTVIYRPEGYFACLGPSVPLNLKEKPEKVGVFVDHEEGLVSFYDVKNRRLIYSFEELDFSETLYPFFSPCNNESGKNADPLIIWPVSQ